MQKKLITSIGLILFLNILVKSFWILGIDLNVQNLVGPTEYGFYFTILNFTFVFNILLDFGITNFNQRNIAQHGHLLNKYLSSILVLKIMLAVVYVVIIFSAALLTGFRGRQIELLYWLAGNQILVSFILYMRSNITGLLLFKTDSFISILDRVLMILICSVLIWGNLFAASFKIEWFVYAQSISYVITALISGIIVFKRGAFVKLNFNTKLLYAIVKKSLPFALLVFLMAFYNRIDAVFLYRLLPGDVGATQAGYYAAGYRLLDAANMIAFLVSFFLLPTFARLIKEKQSILQVTRLSFTLLFVISFTVAVLCFTYNDEIMNMLYVRNVDITSKIFKFIIIGFIPISMNYVFGTLLTANGNLKYLNVIALGSVIINVTLNILLVPRLMAMGSVISSLSAQFATSLAQIVLAFIIFKFKMDYRFAGRILLFSVGVVLSAYFTYQLEMNWLYRFVFAILACGIIILATRLINIKGVIALIKEREK